jgi:hypothetical protein
MSRNTIIMLIYYGHKLLELILSWASGILSFLNSPWGFIIAVVKYILKENQGAKRMDIIGY